MSQNEWNNAWDSAQKVLLIYMPYIFISIVMSLCQFVEKHWRREPFSLAKMITGLVNNLFFTFMLYFGTSWLTNGNKHAIMFVVIFGAFQGKEWADKAIKRILWDRYGNNYYGGYGNGGFNGDIPPEFQDNLNNNAPTGDGNNNGSNDHQKLDPGE